MMRDPVQTQTGRRDGDGDGDERAIDELIADPYLSKVSFSARDLIIDTNTKGYKV